MDMEGYLLKRATMMNMEGYFRYFPKGIFPSGNFPMIFFQVETSQLCNLQMENSQVCPNRRARPPAWEIVICEVAHGRTPLGKDLTPVSVPAKVIYYDGYGRIPAKVSYYDRYGRIPVIVGYYDGYGRIPVIVGYYDGYGRIPVKISYYDGNRKCNAQNSTDCTKGSNKFSSCSLRRYISIS